MTDDSHFSDVPAERSESHDGSPFYADIKEFDRCLTRPFLNELSLDDARFLLARIESFNHVAKAVQETQVLSKSDEYMIAVGCRLSSDLSEAIQDRLVDLVHARESDIVEMSVKLREQMRERFLANSLLTKASDIRTQTAVLGEKMGLGVVL